jgi:hypothetical protein
MCHTLSGVFNKAAFLDPATLFIALGAAAGFNHGASAFVRPFHFALHIDLLGKIASIHHYTPEISPLVQ